jgi:hypothetical protein
MADDDDNECWSSTPRRSARKADARVPANSSHDSSDDVPPISEDDCDDDEKKSIM